jgi:hypothetical protein
MGLGFVNKEYSQMASTQRLAERRIDILAGDMALFGKPYARLREKELPRLGQRHLVFGFDLVLNCVWTRDQVNPHSAIISRSASRSNAQPNRTFNPTDAWVAQQLREATAYGQAPRFSIRGNDGKFGSDLPQAPESSGIKLLKIPYRSPEADATCNGFGAYGANIWITF